jgi:hypothetical protein
MHKKYMVKRAITLALQITPLKFSASLSSTYYRKGEKATDHIGIQTFTPKICSEIFYRLHYLPTGGRMHFVFLHYAYN